MTQVLQLAVMDVAKSVAGVAVANAINIPKMLDFGDSFVLRNASNGALYFLVSDSINYLTGSGSKLISGDLSGSADDVLFFTAVSGVADASGTGVSLFNFIRSSTGLGRDTSEVIAESAIVSGGRFLADYIDQQAQTPHALKILRHPVGTLMGKI